MKICIQKFKMKYCNILWLRYRVDKGFESVSLRLKEETLIKHNSVDNIWNIQSEFNFIWHFNILNPDWECSGFVLKLETCVEAMIEACIIPGKSWGCGMIITSSRSDLKTISINSWCTCTRRLMIITRISVAEVCDKFKEVWVPGIIWINTRF